MTWDVVVVGAGVAGLSAAIYLGRARRDALVISAGRSMAVWEPEVQNYLGFPGGVSGEELIGRGREQAQRYGVQFAEDRVGSVTGGNDDFTLTGEGEKPRAWRARKVLLATGIFHLPPKIAGVKECLGHSMFFCKDCDGIRVQGKRIAIYGSNNETVDYALGMLCYSSRVSIVLDAHEPRWSAEHAGWLREYRIPVVEEKIREVEHEGCALRSLLFENGDRIALDSLFTTRGDEFHNALARTAGAEIDPATGEIVTDDCLMTTVPGLYAAGCVTAANCQMIIAAGQGATAAQAINRALFQEGLRNHRLRCQREHQLRHDETEPDVVARAS